MSPNEHAQAAISHIEHAVTGALAQAADEGDPNAPRSELCRRLGIPQTERGRYRIASWALFRLHETGRVVPHPSGLGWSAAPHTGPAPQTR